MPAKKTVPHTSTAALQSISAMPVRLHYKASLKTVVAENENGETVFRWRSPQEVARTTYIEALDTLGKRIGDTSEDFRRDYQKMRDILGAKNGEPLTRSQLEFLASINIDQEAPELLPLDPRAIATEFFAVKTERDALNFLRHNGTFLPMSEDLGEISWREFQLWQSFAELVKERTLLATVHEAVLNGAAESTLANVDPDGTLRLAVRALFGEINTYFGWPLGFSPELIRALESEVDQAIFDNDPEYIRVFCEENPNFSFTETSQRIYTMHRQLQQWFAKPPSHACSIIHRRRSPEATGYTANPSALACLADPTDLVPILRINAECSLHAIAATLYADRIAGVVFQRCKGCNSLFSTQGLKTFCSTRCKNRVRTQDFRDRKKAKQAAMVAKSRSKKSVVAQLPNTPRRRKA